MRRSERLHVGSIPAPAARQRKPSGPDEEPVLKTGGGRSPFVGSSPTASAFVNVITEAIRMVEEPAWKAGGGTFAACGFEPHGFRLRGHGPTGRRQLRTLEIWVRLPVTPLEKHGPVVQRPRRLAYTQETMVQFRPGPLSPRYANAAERLGLNPSVCGFDSGHRPKGGLGHCGSVGNRQTTSA